MIGARPSWIYFLRCGSAQVAHVVLVKSQAIEIKVVSDEAGLGDAFCTIFNTGRLCSLHGKLNGVMPLKTSQVKHKKLA
jgi:hypothetical protein